MSQIVLISSLPLTLAAAKCHSSHVSEVSSLTVMVINGWADATEKEGPAGGSEEHNANELAAAHMELEHKKEFNHTMLPGSSAFA